MYIGTRGDSVIDYVIKNEILSEEEEEVKIKESIESDHMRVVVSWKEGGEEERMGEREKDVIIWG